MFHKNVKDAVRKKFNTKLPIIIVFILAVTDVLAGPKAYSNVESNIYGGIDAKIENPSGI